MKTMDKKFLSDLTSYSLTHQPIPRDIDLPCPLAGNDCGY